MSGKVERLLLPSLAGLNLNKGSKSTGAFVTHHGEPLKLEHVDGEMEEVRTHRIYTIGASDISIILDAFIEDGYVFFASSPSSIRAFFSDTETEIEIFSGKGMDYGLYDVHTQSIMYGIDTLVYDELARRPTFCDSRACYFDIPLDMYKPEYDRNVHAAAAIFDRATYYRLNEVNIKKSLGVRIKAMRPTDVAARRDHTFQHLREKRELQVMLFMANIGVSPEIKCAFLSYTVEYRYGRGNLLAEGVVSITESGWKPLAANLSTAAATKIQRWDIRTQMLDIVNKLSEHSLFIVGSIDSNSVVCKPIDGDTDLRHHVRIASFDPLFTANAVDTGSADDYRVSDDCRYFVNLLMFLHSALKYPEELRILLMKEIAISAVAKWTQMEANKSLTPFCEYLQLDLLEKVPAYVPTDPLPEDKFPIVDYLVDPDQTKTALREAFHYSIRGFNDVIPDGEGRYMYKILTYLAESYELVPKDWRDRVSLLNAQGTWKERRPPRGRAPSSGGDDSQPPPKRR